QQKNIKVHIISGGLLPGILPFAEYLQIPSAHVHAVPYSPENPEPTFTHPLAMNGGKPATISAVLKSAGISADKALLIGDGVSDLEAKDVVGMFVGFGGVVSRQAVKSASPQYIDAPLLDPLLDIVLQ
ncbi:MAG: haloacid dehalogenase, partial [Planctomycetota bacterium]|nr:haloacid dehalogenase [Planctomycetota bacterium]